MIVNPIPEGFHTITPFFTAQDANKLLKFLKKAFNAEEQEIHTNENGKILNAIIKIGDSMVMVGEAHNGVEESKVMKSMLYMYVTDVDSLYKNAILAGGKSIMEPINQFYGDRSGAVEDPEGNQWWIATHIEALSREEINKRAAQRYK